MHGFEEHRVGRADCPKVRDLLPVSGEERGRNEEGTLAVVFMKMRSIRAEICMAASDAENLTWRWPANLTQ